MEPLLELHGSILEMGEGYWVKIEATRVPPDKGRPQGIAYSLTLHSPQNDRLLGYDNAHAIRSGNGPGGRAKPPNDHCHKNGSAKRYHWIDAEKLLCDFWEDVNTILSEEGVGT